MRARALRGSVHPCMRLRGPRAHAIRTQIPARKGIETECPGLVGFSGYRAYKTGVSPVLLVTLRSAHDTPGWDTQTALTSGNAVSQSVIRGQSRGQFPYLRRCPGKECAP